MIKTREMEVGTVSLETKAQEGAQMNLYPNSSFASLVGFMAKNLTSKIHRKNVETPRDISKE